MLRKIQDPKIRNDFKEGYKELFTHQIISMGYARAAIVLTKANGRVYSVVLESFYVGGAYGGEIIGAAVEITYERARELARLNPESDYQLRFDSNKYDGLNEKTWKEYI